MNTNFMVNLGHQIETITNTFTVDGYQALADVLRAPLGSAVILYIVLVGYATARGLIENTPKELFKLSLRLGIIYLLAMNWGNFATYVRDFFVIGSESMANAVMKSASKTHSNQNIFQGLQSVFNTMLDLGSSTMGEGGYRNLSPYFCGILIYLSGALTLGLAFFEIVIAKLMLSITLCTAPLFLSLTLFDQTKPFFDRWLGLLVGFSLVLVFVSSVLGLTVDLMSWAMTQVDVNQGDLKGSTWVPLFIVSLFCIMGILEAASIGKSIGGAASTSGGAAMVGGFIGAAMGAGAMAKQASKKSKSAAKTGKSAVSRSAQFAKNIHQTIRGGQS